ITPYQCLYLTYMSSEDWREKTDILWCNPNFHNGPRYDCVIINTSPMTFARLEFIFTCEDMSRRRYNIALIRNLEYFKWRAKDEMGGLYGFGRKELFICSPKYLIRGCHLIPTFEKDEGKYYLNDLVESDAFV
ncbi:hypothetical protein M422DRAFT_189096, partial [Sphaerobolus stellatus SS14]